MNGQLRLKQHKQLEIEIKKLQQLKFLRYW